MRQQGDIILNACRNNKSHFVYDDLVSQMNFWKSVQKKGYPHSLFNSLQDYEKFSNVLTNLSKKWGLPNKSIFVQGSSLKISDVSKIGDLDIAIKVSSSEFDTFVRQFKSVVSSDKVLRRIGNNGKIGGLDMFLKGKKKSFTVEFYEEFEKVFMQNFSQKLGVEKIQISIIKKGSNIDISPYLKTK